MKGKTLNSVKLKDIKPGRVVQIAATEKTRATSILVTEVLVFQKAARVTGTKLMRNGEAHKSGKVHSALIEEGTFLVTWEELAEGGAVASTPVLVSETEELVNV